MTFLIILVANILSKLEMLRSFFSSVVMMCDVMLCYGVPLNRIAAMNQSPLTEVPLSGMAEMINKHQADPMCEK